METPGERSPGQEQVSEIFRFDGDADCRDGACDSCGLWKITSDGALRGIGAMTPFMLATISDVVVRILCGCPFSVRWGPDGAWAVWPMAWLVGTAMSVGFCLVLSRKKMGREDREPAGET